MPAEDCSISTVLWRRNCTVRTRRGLLACLPVRLLTQRSPLARSLPDRLDTMQFAIRFAIPGCCHFQITANRADDRAGLYRRFYFFPTHRLFRAASHGLAIDHCASAVLGFL
jgi:hypothetical protein